MRAYTYKQLTFPDPLDVISLASIKEYLKIDSSEASENDILTLLIGSVVDFFEKYTKRELLTKQFITYRDCWSYREELRRSKFVSLDSVKYYIDDVLTVYATSNFYTTDESDFSMIVLKDDQSFPNIDDRLQAIQITFKAGYGDDYSDIPSDILLALRAHIAYMYVNRGDCSSFSQENVMAFIPNTAFLIYEKYRIIDILI